MRFYKNIFLYVIVLMIASSAVCFGGEYPIIDDSSVIGRNYGYPAGTPTTGMTEPGNLDLVIESVVFAKNLELVSVGIDGETFIGFMAPLRLRYRAHEQVTFEAGASIRYDFGDGNDVDEVEPILRLVYEPVPSAYLFAGTIIGTHAIHDALYNDSEVFEQTTQQGIQFRMDRTELKQDHWINWRVKETADTAERFDVGSVTQLRLGELWLDAQIFIRHTGGQKNTEFHDEKSNFAYLLGGSYGIAQNITGLIDKVRAGVYYLGDYDDMHSSSDLDSTSGSGVEGTLTCEMIPKEDINVHLFASYFYGDELYARAGDPLYAADDYAQLGTNIIFKLPEGLRIEFGIDGQFYNDSIVHTAQVYFVWGRGVTLSKGI